MTALRRFGRDTRGAAGITAALLSVMFLGGTALVVDHLWLVDHRDALKTAADAAAVAATLRMAELAAEPDEDAVRNKVQTVAERYVRLNLLPNLPASGRARARDTLEVTLPDFDRSAGVLQVDASADLGGTLLAERLFGYPDDCEVNASADSDLPPCMKQRAGVEAAITPTELVLAIDATGSMAYTLDGEWRSGHPESKMGVVRSAALELVDILDDRTGDGPAPVAVGVVPWHHQVQLRSALRTRWEDHGWAKYLDERTYPNPYDGRKGNPSGASPLTVSLPSRPEPWKGCLDQRSTDGIHPPAFSAEHPDDAPFSMNFYTDHVAYPEDEDIAFACDASAPESHKGWNLCYDESAIPRADRANDVRYWIRDPQPDCRGDDRQAIHPLTSDLDAVRRIIRNLQGGGSATYSTLGVAWGMRLLDPGWRDVWGDSVHPMEPTDGEGVQKILVLLTDGDDNHHDREVTDEHRQQVCTAAKAAGVRVFTIAAMDDRHRDHTHLAEELERCSSQADDPDGRYVFVNNATRADLEDAFRDIGGQLLVMRRTF